AGSTVAGVSRRAGAGGAESWGGAGAATGEAGASIGAALSGTNPTREPETKSARTSRREALIDQIAEYSGGSPKYTSSGPRCSPEKSLHQKVNQQETDGD